jgi:GntR family transcriptional repressor for pyruvate dehydrogenase complex
MGRRVDGRTRADQVRDQIVALIRDRGFVEGTKLPTEPELVEMFGVGRSSVRAAMQSLVGIGMVEMRPGRGAFVCRLSLNEVVRMVGAAIKLEYAAAHQLHEARAMIEVTAARLAAKRRTDDDLARMRTAIDQYRDAWQADDLDGMVNSDLSFHAAVIKATRNEVMDIMLASISGLLHEQRRQYALAELDARGAVVIAGHIAIYTAIEHGDPAEAQHQAREHMRSISAQIDSISAHENATPWPEVP